VRKRPVLPGEPQRSKSNRRVKPWVRSVGQICVQRPQEATYRGQWHFSNRPRHTHDFSYVCDGSGTLDDALRSAGIAPPQPPAVAVPSDRSPPSTDRGSGECDNGTKADAPAAGSVAASSSPVEPELDWGVFQPPASVPADTCSGAPIQSGAVWRGSFMVPNMQSSSKKVGFGSGMFACVLGRETVSRAAGSVQCAVCSVQRVG